MNFFKHHIGDYDSATMHLSWDEDMAYTRLMRVYYRDEKPLPLELRQVYRLVRASSKVQREAIEVVLAEFFLKQDDGWHNKRCDEEVSAAQAQAEINRRIATNRPRSVNGSSTNGSPVHTNLGDLSRLQTPDSNIQTPISNNHTPSGGRGGKLRFKTADEYAAEEIANAAREGRSANI